MDIDFNEELWEWYSISALKRYGALHSDFFLSQPAHYQKKTFEMAYDDFIKNVYNFKFVIDHFCLCKVNYITPSKTKIVLTISMREAERILKLREL